MFFDIGVGLLVTTLVGLCTGMELSWTWIAIGLFGSLWPDLDFIIWLTRGKKIDKWAHQHRDLLHKPVLVFFLALLVGALLGWQASVLFMVTSFAHFVHDTIGHAWGIKWFWPLNSEYFCYRSYGDQPAQWHRWTKKGQDALCRLYGDDQWKEHAYGRLSRSLIIELVVMIGGVASVGVWYFLTR